MPVEVNEAAIRERRRWMSTWPSPAVDLLVTTSLNDRHAAADRVRDLLKAVPIKTCVYPTTPGTYVFLEDGERWPEVVEALAERGGAGTAAESVTLAAISAPVRSPVWDQNLGRLGMTVLLAFSLDPPVSAGPFNVHGRPTLRWSVPPTVTESILDAVVPWASAAGTLGELYAGPFIPASAKDAADLIRLSLADNVKRIELRFAEVGGAARSVEINSFGQVGLYQLDAPTRPPTQTLADLVSLVRAHAAGLDVAVLRLMQRGYTAFRNIPDSHLWGRNRHLWSSRVPDASAAQILTTDHLDHAHDLSAWTVEQIATDRWLVQTTDLDPWFPEIEADTFYRTPPPPAEILSQARRDFGEMILTREVAAANPMNPST